MGDPALGEWVEWTGYAYHIRRRLTPEEQTIVGPIVDVRDTDDGRLRVQRMWKWIGPLVELEPVLAVEVLQAIGSGE